MVTWMARDEETKGLSLWVVVGALFRVFLGAFTGCSPQPTVNSDLPILSNRYFNPVLMYDCLIVEALGVQRGGWHLAPPEEPYWTTSQYFLRPSTSLLYL